MVNRIKFLVLGITLILLCPSIFATSVTPAYVKVNFEPNAVVQYGFFFCGASKIRSYLDGELTEYATIIDDDPEGGCRTIQVMVEFPDKIEKPGEHQLLVGGLQLVDAARGGVAGRAAIEAPIVIFVPYPGYYIEVKVKAPNVNEGETVQFTIEVRNLGTNDISNARAVIDIYDDNSKLKSLATNELAIDSKTAEDLWVDLSTAGMKAGSYKAIVTIYYDGQVLTKEEVFNIGSLFVRINNYTTELFPDEINRLDIDVESRWNNQINGMYAEVTINDDTVKSANFDLSPWKKKTVNAYFDTAGMSYGEYNATVAIFYEGEKTVETGKVYIIEKIQIPSEEPEEEKPISINLNITPTTILIAIIVLLVLVDIVWVVMRKRKKK